MNGRSVSHLIDRYRLWPRWWEGYTPRDYYLLEDNTERLQLVISPDLWQEQREALRDAPLLVSEGELHRDGRAWTLRADGVWGAGG